MTLAEAATPPARLASWNFRFLGVSVAGDIMHAEFVRRTIGTASLWRRATSLACRRRTSYADIQCRLMQKKPLQETKALEMPKKG